MSDYFSKISELQHSLNCLIGRDTINNPDKIMWFYDYCQAMQDEIMELKNCINWKWWTKESKDHGQYNVIIDPKNAKIEIIDILHFYVSLVQILDVNLDEFNYAFDDLDDLVTSNPAEDVFFHCEHLMFYTTDSKMYTSWYKDYDFKEGRTHILDIINPDLMKQDIVSIWINILSIFKCLNMNAEDILSIYQMKYEKNIQRQKDNYAVLTKTEDDNNEIKSKI